MNVTDTGLANSIEIGGDRPYLDERAKRIIRHKIVLAEILKDCVDEFAGFDRDYIATKCIIGEPELHLAVDQDAQNMRANTDGSAREAATVNADMQVTGQNTEDASINEGTIHYDYIVRAIVPCSNIIVSLIINIEVQNESHLRYAKVTRAIYYLARLISRQKGTVFQHSDYHKLQKVYSIWICTDPAESERNSLAVYGFSQLKTVGRVNESPVNYDKMQAIIINLDKESMGIDGDAGIADETDREHRAIRFLSLLLLPQEPARQRLKKIGAEFGRELVEKVEKEVNDMDYMATAIARRSFDAGAKIKKEEKEGWLRAGRDEGIQDASVRTAKEMLKNGEPIWKILAYSQLDEIKIRDLALEMGCQINKEA